MKQYSGLADSPFFTAPPPTPEPVKRVFRPETTDRPASDDTVIPRSHDTALDFVQARVQTFGKEAATYRFTATEKQALAKLIYAYKARGVRTTENEVIRIALNALLHDQQQQGEQSLLAAVLRHLHA